MFDPTKIISQLKDLGSVPTKVILFVWLSSGLLLAAPAGFVSALRLERLMSDHGHWVGITWLLSSVFLTVSISYGWHAIWERHKRRRLQEARASKTIAELAFAERAVLREFVFQQQPVVNMPIDDAVVVGLIHNGVLERVSGLGNYSSAGMVFPLRITEVAERLLKAEHLDLRESPSEYELKQFVSQRPHFAAAIEWRESLRRGPVGW